MLHESIAGRGPPSWEKRGTMGFLEGKTAIITGAGFAALKDGSAGSIGYGIADRKSVV